MTDAKSCALCNSTSDATGFAVPSRSDEVVLCGVCRPQVEGAELNVKHWYCLQESAWSQEPAVQVLAWRLLTRLNAETWAVDLLEQLYFEDAVLAWAKEGAAASSTQEKVVDSNGTELRDGDSVTLIKDLDVKGAGFTAKRGTLVKNVKLGDDPTHIEGRVHKTAIFLKTSFLKKA
ncbi:MAG: alkylphosphonate utilization protein [Deltaproteobacteria bacterium]|nr:alkylphosphonate utilization protein [Deltaproteobacteria bacterium]